MVAANDDHRLLQRFQNQSFLKRRHMQSRTVEQIPRDNHEIGPCGRFTNRFVEAANDVRLREGHLSPTETEMAVSDVCEL
jgi:hypothetical protein